MSELLQEVGVQYKRTDPNSVIESGYTRFHFYRINVSQRHVSIDHVDILNCISHKERDFIRLLTHWTRNGWYYSPK